MSLRLFFLTLHFVPPETVFRASNEALNELNLLFLGAHEGIAPSFVVLPYLHEFLLMSSERLVEYFHCLCCRESGKLFEFVIREAFRVKNEADIRRLWSRNLSQSSATGFRPLLILFHNTLFQWCHGNFLVNRQGL